jgi:adenylate cyclase
VLQKSCKIKWKLLAKQNILKPIINSKSVTQEIERKFLVKGDFKTQATKSINITQAYLSSVPERSVRIRILDNQAFLTIKGKSNETGISRYEWEKEIDIDEAKELLKICEPGAIRKTRHQIKVGRHIFEVDEFHDKNEGLIVAEIELVSENEEFEKPDWLGEEVTGQQKYYNAQLSLSPYLEW